MNRDLIKKAGAFIVAKSPEILAGTAVLGVGATGVLSARAGVRHQEAVADAEVAKMEALGLSEIPELTLKEKALAVWRIWAPPVAVGLATCGCIIGSNRVSAGRLAVVTASGLLIEQSYDDLKAAVIEKLGVDAYDEVKDEVSARKIERMGEVDESAIFGDPNPLDVLFLDSVSGRYFYCSKDKMQDIEHDLNKWLLHGEFISLNDFYASIPLPSVSIGEDLGWDINSTGLVDFEYGTAEGPNHTPCYVLNYTPTSRYRHYYGD